MEIIDTGLNSDMCTKCNGKLSTNDKRSRMPICTKCIIELINMVSSQIVKDDLKEFSDNVSNFTDFILSSSKLMRLDDMVVIQVCFNIYMDIVGKMEKRNTATARKILGDAKGFIEIELERLEYGKSDCCHKNKEEIGKEELFENIMGLLNDIEKGCNRENDKNDNVDNNDLNNKMEDKKDDNEGENKKTKTSSNGSKRIKIN